MSIQNNVNVNFFKLFSFDFFVLKLPVNECEGIFITEIRLQVKKITFVEVITIAGDVKK